MGVNDTTSAGMPEGRNAERQERRTAEMQRQRTRHSWPASNSELLACGFCLPAFSLIAFRPFAFRRERNDSLPVASRKNQLEERFVASLKFYTKFLV